MIKHDVSSISIFAAENEKPFLVILGMINFLTICGPGQKSLRTSDIKQCNKHLNERIYSILY